MVIYLIDVTDNAKTAKLTNVTWCVRPPFTPSLQYVGAHYAYNILINPGNNKKNGHEETLWNSSEPFLLKKHELMSKDPSIAHVAWRAGHPVIRLRNFARRAGHPVIRVRIFAWRAGHRITLETSLLGKTKQATNSEHRCYSTATRGSLGFARLHCEPLIGKQGRLDRE